MAAAMLGAVALLLLLPEPAWAFGPATHIFLGEHLLGSLTLLPEWIRLLLQAYPNSFLYGSVAADISFAKKYVPAGRHCHYWHVGEEIFETAENDRQRAVAVGYLSHLAADTIAHNYFVPRQLLVTSSTKALGHSYWEARLDAQLGERFTSRAREVVLDYDHSEADTLFDAVLSGTIFSFETNRRIFRGMIRVQDNDRWRSVFEQLVQNSRWALADEAIDGYISRAFDFVVDYLNRRHGSAAASLDPTGEFNLQLAKRIRRLAMREGAWQNPKLLTEMADDFFPLPEPPVRYWGGRAAANGVPAASTNGLAGSEREPGVA
ncbi:MAG TPA: zinc dependent phospholipase C family protein [Longimicrobiales bacterium]|nr:zinc dependent phospholipase C family protein [Longimicrobiales bacterium]